MFPVIDWSLKCWNSTNTVVLFLQQKEEEIIQLIDVVGKLEKDRSLLERRIKDNTEQKVSFLIN